MKYISIALLIISGCTIRIDDPIDAKLCNPEDRVGRYKISFDEHYGGTCGYIPDTIISVSVHKTSKGICTVYQSEYSDDGCLYTSSVQCDDWENFTYEQLKTESHVNDPSADTISGTLIVRKRWIGTDSLICASMYDIEYVRQ